MKKLLAFILCAVTLVSTAVFAGCDNKKDEVNFKYYNEGSEIVAMLKAGTEQIGMLPEPAATMLEKQTPDDTWYRLDVQELYDSQAKAYPQAVLMAKSSLLSAYPQIVSVISSSIAENVSWAKQNPALAVSAIASKLSTTTLKAPMLSEKSIDGCKIYFQSAEDAKTSVNKYINDIRSIDNASANVVDDDFFYQASGASGTWSSNEITFYAPDGAPAISIAKFINDNASLGTDKTVDYNVVTAATIVGKMALGDADIILLPINGASKKYKADGNASDPYKLVSVLTHGNFYIMSKTQITLKDLVGGRIAVPNMGAVPDWTIRTVLSKNNFKINVVD